MAQLHILKAQLKMTDMADPMRQKLATECYQKALEADNSLGNVFDFTCFVSGTLNGTEQAEFHLKSLPLYRQMAEADPRRGKPELVKVLNSLADRHVQSVDWESAQAECQEAMATLQGLPDEILQGQKAIHSETLRITANLELDLGKIQSALENYAKGPGLATVALEGKRAALWRGGGNDPEQHGRPAFAARG